MSSDNPRASEGMEPSEALPTCISLIAAAHITPFLALRMNILNRPLAALMFNIMDKPLWENKCSLILFEHRNQLFLVVLIIHYELSKYN